MRRPLSTTAQPALTSVAERPTHFASAFIAGAVGCRLVRYTSAFAQSLDARDTRRVTFTVRLPLSAPALTTHGAQTGMRGLMGVGT